MSDVKMIGSKEKETPASLYIGNLHQECTEAILYQKFSEIGKILSIRVCKDALTGNSLKYGYVNYANQEEAKKAMDTMNYDHLQGQPIRIMWAHKDLKTKLTPAANLVVKNLDKSIDDKILSELFAPYGDIMAVKVAMDAKGESKGFGFVQFATEKSAYEAISVLDGTVIESKKVAIHKFIPFEERKKFHELSHPNNIFVKNLAPSLTNSDLEELCKRFGDIKSCTIVTGENNKSKGYGFVSFSSSLSAAEAIKDLNNVYLNGKKLFASSAKFNCQKDIE